MGFSCIDLVQTAQLIEEAYEFVRGEADRGKRFLFIGTKRQAGQSLNRKLYATVATSLTNAG
jgi:small subunit ribosomal protein S2